MSYLQLWKEDELLQEPRCSLCKSDSFTPIFTRADGLPLHECGACRFVYLGMRPDRNALERYYADQYFDNSATYHGYFDYAQAVSDLNYCPRIKRMQPFIDDWKEKSVLEIGCAAGTTLELLRRKGATVRGIELSSVAASIAVDHYKLDVLNSAFESSLLSGAQYDAVMMFDVLEHLPAPGEVLSELTGLLRPGGRLVLTVPNFNRFDQVGGQWKGVLSYWEHLHYFRAEVLQLALEKRGYQVVELHTFTGAGQEDGLGRETKMRNLRQNLTDAFPLLRLPLRLLRKARFLVKGPPPLPRSRGLSGMDLFCLAQKGGGGVSSAL